MKTLNVLSIDWDYFINATYLERGSMFPDGGNENIPDVIKNIIWSGLYSSNDELVSISVDKKALNFTTRVLRHIPTDAPMMVTDSHRYAYDFIKNQMYEQHANQLHVTNIDFHHDVYDMGSNSVDCGNWLRILMKEYHSENDSFAWVRRSDSDMDRTSNRLQCVHLDSIKSKTWNVIFICRSGMWSPPHLDKNFKKAFYDIAYEHSAVIQSDIFDSRYPKISREAKKTRDQYAILKSRVDVQC